MNDLVLSKGKKPIVQKLVTDLTVQVLSALRNLRSNPDKDKYGCFIGIVDQTTGFTVLHCRVGTIPPTYDADYGSKANKYRELALKKAHQLYVNAKQRGHISGWQARDDDQDQYGGAVAGARYIFGTSGLSEYGDEIVSLINADAFDEVDPDPIIHISQNPFWAPISTWWHDGGNGEE